MATVTTDELPVRNKQERVHATLRERILTGVYGPGYRIVIDSLATELEVSAQPVREAVRRLEAEGLIVYRANVGAQVTPPEPGLFDSEMELLAILDGYATALAAPALTREDLDELRSINAQMSEAMQRMDPIAFGRLNQSFHETIYARCPNPPLLRMLTDVARRLDSMRRTVFVQIPYRGAESVNEHVAIIELLDTGAPSAKVERAAREHKLKTLASFDRWRREEHRGPDRT